MKNFFENLKNELDTHDYIDWIRHESNKKFLFPVIFIVSIVVITIVYLVSTYKSDWTFLENQEKIENWVETNLVNNDNKEDLISEQEKEKIIKDIKIKENLLTTEEINEIRNNYEKDQKTSTQEFFWLNIKWSDFFKQEFLTFLSQNEIKNLRMKLKDFLEYNKLTTKYINWRNMSITVYIENKNDIKLIKELKWSLDFVWIIEVPFKWFEVEWLKEVNNELKKLNQENSTNIKMIIVGNEDEIKLLYEKNLSYLFDFWWVYENESLEKSQDRIRKINAQLHLNNERSTKSVVLVNFTSKDDLEFMKWIRKIQVVNHLYFNDYLQYNSILQKTIEERIKEIKEKSKLMNEQWNSNVENTENNWNNTSNNENKVENTSSSSWPIENTNVQQVENVIQLPNWKEIDEETKKEIDRINSIEDIKQRNLEILKIIDKL